jgi:aspartate aminotransferase-like enzyme
MNGKRVIHKHMHARQDREDATMILNARLGSYATLLRTIVMQELDSVNQVIIVERGNHATPACINARLRKDSVAETVIASHGSTATERFTDAI